MHHDKVPGTTGDERKTVLSPRAADFVWSYLPTSQKFTMPFLDARRDRQAREVHLHRTEGHQLGQVFGPQQVRVATLVKITMHSTVFT